MVFFPVSNLIEKGSGFGVLEKPWTGRQVFSSLLKNNFRFDYIDTSNKSFVSASLNKIGIHWGLYVWGFHLCVYQKWLGSRV